MVKKYRAVFQAAKPIVNEKRPILLISVGQSYYEESKLSAIIDLMNRSGFDHCTIMLADSLQRYNYLQTLSEAEAYQFALKMGNEWIERNQLILNKLTIPYEIIRWDSHYEHESFSKKYRDYLLRYYHEDEKVRKAFDLTISKYLDRQGNLNSEEDYKKIQRNCFAYVMEECPILMPLWASQGYDYIIYPKKMTLAMQITYEKFVAKEYPGKVQWLSLRFREKSETESN